MSQNKYIYRTASPSERKILNNIWHYYGGNNEAAQTTYNALIKRYDEPHRAYHNVGHLVELFEYFYAHKTKFKNPQAVALALFYHDAIYAIKSSDNEDLSADLASIELSQLGFNKEISARVTDLIIMTKTHDCDQSDYDAALMLDMDMAVLGLSNPNYRRYARSIQAEYSPFFTIECYRARRMQFLVSVENKERLFMTEIFEDRYGAQAIDNIKDEYLRLQKQKKSKIITHSL